MNRRCLYCPRGIKKGKDGQWVHEDKGMMWIMYCKNCDWQGEQPSSDMTFLNDFCPNCRMRGTMRDHHAATIPFYESLSMVKGGE